MLGKTSERRRSVLWAVLFIVALLAIGVAGWWTSPSGRTQTLISSTLDELSTLPEGETVIVGDFGECLRIEKEQSDGTWIPVAWERDQTEGIWYSEDPIEAIAEYEGFEHFCGLSLSLGVEVRLPNLGDGTYQVCGPSSEDCEVIEISS